MKRKSVLCLCVVFAFILGGCDLYVNRQPWNYNDSIWVCDEPNITYYVEGSKDDENFNTYAIAYVNGEKMFLEFGFQSSMVHFMKETEVTEILLIGDCKYGKDSFIVTVSPEYDELFWGKYKQLIFSRKS